MNLPTTRTYCLRPEEQSRRCPQDNLWCRIALLVVALLAMQPRELECGKAAKATPRCEPERRRLPYAASQQRTAAFRRKACSDVETTHPEPLGQSFGASMAQPR